MVAAIRVFRVIATGHEFVRNLRRCHYDISADTLRSHRLRLAFDELVLTI
jgi:hypothetical protein